MPYISLISPPGRAKSQYPPLSLMCIAGYLRKHNIEVDIIDFKTSPYEHFNKTDIVNKIIKRIKENKPKIIGITSLSPDVKDVLDMSKSIKQECEVIIVVGGVHATVCPHDFIYKNSPIDYAVIGEGEETMLELIQKISSHEEISQIKGISYFKEKMITTESRPHISNLDNLPFLPYDLIDMKYYSRPQTSIIRPLFLSGFYLFTGRGCPYDCSFCVNKNVWKKKVRFRSCKNVVDEIEYLVKTYEIDGIYIIDETFALKKERVIAICNEIRKRKLDIIWGCQTRVNTITDEMVKAMKQAGCVQIDFGVESGSQKVLDGLSKGITVEQIKRAFNICQKYKIRTFANIMLNTVDETEDDVKKTIDLCDEIKPDVCSYAIMTPFPGTDIYSKIKPLSIDEYQLCNTAPTSFNPRFKFSEHNMDLDNLLYRLYKKNRTYKNMLSGLLSVTYVKKIIKSKRKSQYILEFVHFAKYWLPRVIRF